MIKTYGRGKEIGTETFFYSNQWLFGAMFISAVLCLVAAFVLSVDAVVLAADPNAALSCNISQIISCGTVANSWQATLFGFPNAFLGLIFEPIVLTVALASLSGTTFRRFFMAGLQALYTFALAFALWLFTQSAFVIHAFCPWCLLITLGTTLTFFTLLRFNIRENNLYLPKGIQEFSEFMIRVHGDLMVEAILIAGVIGTIIINYGPALLRV